jgi:hypothetical protein
VPLPCDAPPWRAERAEAEWREAIALARRRAGDYTPTINARIRAPRTSAATAPAAADKATEAPPADAGTAAAPCWRLRFQVTEGRNALVRELRVALHDSDDAALRDIVDSQPLRIGEPFLESRYESFKSALSRQAEETGYFDARFTEHRVDIYPEDAVADVALVFAPGTRYAFGDLRIDPARVRGIRIAERDKARGLSFGGAEATLIEEAEGFDLADRRRGDARARGATGRATATAAGRERGSRDNDQAPLQEPSHGAEATPTARPLPPFSTAAVNPAGQESSSELRSKTVQRANRGAARNHRPSAAARSRPVAPRH